MISRREIFRSSTVVGFFSLLGGLAGILVETSIAARLGLSKGSDTFYIAYTLPYLITTLLSATGQFSLVPFFGSLDARHAPEELWRGFSYAINMIFLGLSAIALIGVAGAAWVIRGIAPGFTPEQTALATQLTRWLFLIIVPAGVAEVFRSFLFSQRRFTLSAAASLFCNTVVIVCVVGTFSRLGYYSMVLGYIAGYSIQLSILAAQTFILFPVRYSFVLRGSGEAFRNLHGAGSAQMGAAVSWQVVVLVERIIASFLPAGTLTALNYGMKIMSALSELLAGSVGTVTLPALSRAVARKAHVEERKIFQDALEISLVFVFPAVIFCLLLNRNIIRLVFERGNFTPESTALLSMVLFYYSMALLPYAFTRVLTFYFFARHEANTFLRFAIFLFGLTLAFDLLYVGGLGLGAKGIPLALFTASIVTHVLAYQRNLVELKSVFDRSLGWFALKNLMAAVFVALAILGLRPTIPYPQTGLANFLNVCILCGAGSLVFFATLAATRAVPVAQMIAELKRTEDS